jgi:hypothetical protein
MLDISLLDGWVHFQIYGEGKALTVPPVHRVLLSISSPFLAAIFNENFRLI